MKKRCFAFILSIFVIFTFVIYTINAEAEDLYNIETLQNDMSDEEQLSGKEIFQTKDGLVIGNAGYQNYSHNDHPISSYLFSDDAGFTRVAAYAVNYTGWSVGDIDSITKLIIEHYSPDFEIESCRYMELELPIFGGFYEGENAYFMVFGKKNEQESDSAEVMRIVKYDKNWNRLGSASLYGANTYHPFAFGSLRMAEYNGYLYIRTSHTMYTSIDGGNHQANLTVQVNENDMTVVDSFSKIWNISRGYVSHSFNQFIIVDDKANLVALDQGDANPRGAILGKYSKKAGQDGFVSAYSYQNLLSYSGDVGDTATKASIGGLEYSKYSYLTAGNSVVQDEDYDTRTARNVYVTSTNRENFSTTINWITDYTEEDNVCASTPQLVKLGDDFFILLWNLIENKDSFPIKTIDRFKYVFLDGKGNMTSEIYTMNGYLSDCHPIYSNGTIIWYTLLNGIISFYSIDEDGKCSVVNVTPSVSELSIATEGIQIIWDSVPGVSRYRLYKSVDEGSWMEIQDINGISYIDRDVSGGKKYGYKLRSLDNNGNLQEGNYGVFGSFITYLDEPVIMKAVSAEEGIYLNWTALKGAEGYYVYRREKKDENWVLVETITGTYDSYMRYRLPNTYIDTDVLDGHTYMYTIQGYSFENSKSNYNKTGISVVFSSIKDDTDSKNGTNGMAPDSNQTFEPEVTIIPTFTIEPTATIKPTSTIKPPATVLPTSTIKPPATVLPTATIKPTTTIKPTSTIKPPATVLPTSTIEPAITKIPVVTEKPATPTPSTTKLTITNIKNVSSGIQIQWNEVKGTKKYVVFYRSESEESFREVTLDGSATSCVIPYEKLLQLTNYEFTVIANDGTRYTNESEPVTYFVYKQETSTNVTAPQNGKKYTEGGLQYTYKNKCLTVTGIESGTMGIDAMVINIPDKVKISGKSYPVTAIAAKAFYKKGINQVVIGSNIKMIGKKAFVGNPYLWKITIKSKKLNAKNIGADAFFNVGKTAIPKKVTVIAPKKYKTKYKKLLQKRGIKKKIITKEL